MAFRYKYKRGMSAYSRGFKAGLRKARSKRRTVRHRRY